MGITRYCAKIKFYYHEDREMGVIQVNLENLITAFLEEDEGEQERQRGYLKMFCARTNPILRIRKREKKQQKIYT